MGWSPSPTVGTSSPNPNTIVGLGRRPLALGALAVVARAGHLQLNKELNSRSLRADFGEERRDAFFRRRSRSVLPFGQQRVSHCAIVPTIAATARDWARVPLRGGHFNKCNVQMTLRIAVLIFGAPRDFSGELNRS